MDKRTLVIINPDRFNFDPQKVTRYIEFLHDSLNVEAAVAISTKEAGRIARMADDYEFLMVIEGDQNIKEIMKNVNAETQSLGIMPGTDPETVKKWYFKFLGAVAGSTRDTSVTGMMKERVIARC